MKPSTNPLDPAIFREAARLIAEERERYACCALDRVSVEWGIPLVGSDSPACTWFTKVLMPPDACPWCPWYAGYGPDDTDEGDRMARTLGLLLCAELLEEGFSPDE